MINYEMALSEIEMYKKAHESLSENLTHANKKIQQYKAERDTLIDDIAVLRANNKRLERENEQLKQQIEHLKENYESNRKHNKNLIERNKELERKSAAYDKMMTGEMGELYKKAEAFDEILNIDDSYFNKYGHEPAAEDHSYEIDEIISKYMEDE